MTTKLCKGPCGFEKELKEFNKCASNCDGHTYKCKACIRLYNQAHKESTSVQQKVYRKQHKEHRSEYNKLYIKANKEIVSETKKKYRDANKEYRLSYNRRRQAIKFLEKHGYGEYITEDLIIHKISEMEKKEYARYKNTNTGETFKFIREAAASIDITFASLQAMLSGNRINTSPFIIIYEQH